MSPNLQVKLLRVLQERTFEPVGVLEVRLGRRARGRRDQPEPRGARSATERFREDLYYRLNVIPIEVPPLRERREDVPLLRPATSWTARTPRRARAVDGLHRRRRWSGCLAHDWPGNVRELENLVERLVVLAARARSASPTCPARSGPAAAPSASDGAAAPGRRHRLQRRGRRLRDQAHPAGARADRTGTSSAAAQLLGLNRTTLLEKIKKKGLERRRADCWRRPAASRRAGAGSIACTRPGARLTAPDASAASAAACRHRRRQRSPREPAAYPLPTPTPEIPAAPDAATCAAPAPVAASQRPVRARRRAGRRALALAPLLRALADACHARSGLRHARWETIAMEASFEEAMETMLRDGEGEERRGRSRRPAGADRARARAADPLHREPHRRPAALAHRPRRPAQHRRHRSDGRDREVRPRQELQVQDVRRVPDQGRHPRPAPLARLGAAQRAPEEPPPRARLRRGRAAPRPLGERGGGRRLARPPDRQVPRAAEPGARHLAREPRGDPRQRGRTATAPAASPTSSRT